MCSAESTNHLKEAFLTTPTTEADVATHRRELGAVYTPRRLAQWLAQEVAERFSYTPDTVLDPAAGEGALLNAAHEVWPDAVRIALDIDAQALETIPTTVDLKLESDGILSPWPAAKRGSRLIIANPPWGANMTREYRRKLELNFETARGQFDSYDVFLERIATELALDDVAAVFLPDSFFQKQHTITREFIARNCVLWGIYRLGEGVFPGVNMAAIALIFSKGTARSDHKVKFAKLSADARAHVSRGSGLYSKLSEVMTELPQKDLIATQHGVWGFDTRYNSLARNIRTATGTDAWEKWFATGRGLEIGKNGNMLVCPACASVRAFPKFSSPLNCLKCRAPLSPHEDRLELVSTASTPPSNKWVPLAVGQDLHRHSLIPTRWVKSNVDGIDYKNELHPRTKPRLLVRKTGLGIHAAVEWRPTATTQTIYHFTPTDAAPDYAVPYAAGVLSSRILTAWHISASGDGEWRSHPYLTLSSIQSLPLPQPIPGSDKHKVALKIAQNIDQYQREPRYDQLADLNTEHLVAELLGSGPELVDWAVETLSNATGSTYLATLANLPKRSHEDSRRGAGK